MCFFTPVSHPSSSFPTCYLLLDLKPEPSQACPLSLCHLPKQMSNCAPHSQHPYSAPAACHMVLLFSVHISISLGSTYVSFHLWSLPLQVSNSRY